MDLQYRDTVALVTGSSAGIGRSTALQLAAEGATVVATYHSDRSSGQQLVDTIHASGGTASLAPLRPVRPPAVPSV
jgi:3-oxoacyl-[acyl-carrier protein] reductase